MIRKTIVVGVAAVAVIGVSRVLALMVLQRQLVRETEEFLADYELSKR